jgi:hypothetical protein
VRRVPAELRQKLTGHADEKSHAVYTHHEFSTFFEALERIGRLPREREGSSDDGSWPKDLSF